MDEDPGLAAEAEPRQQRWASDDAVADAPQLDEDELLPDMGDGAAQ
jgi:hypothetical protein